MTAKKLSMVFTRQPSFLKWAVLGMFLFIFPTLQAAAANVDIKLHKTVFKSQNRIEKFALKNTSDTEHQSDIQNHLRSDSDSADCGCNPLPPDADHSENIPIIHPKRQINHEF